MLVFDKKKVVIILNAKNIDPRVILIFKIQRKVDYIFLLCDKKMINSKTIKISVSKASI